jgi:hypothetical protein
MHHDPNQRRNPVFVLSGSSSFMLLNQHVDKIKINLHLVYTTNNQLGI